MGVTEKPPPLAAATLAAAVIAGGLATARAPALGLACAGLLLAGLGLGGERVAAIDAPGEAIAGGVAVDGRAVLLERPRRSPFGWSAEIELLGGKAAGARLVARAGGDLDPPSGASVGEEVVVAGLGHPADQPDADDSFDWAAHLQRQGIAGELELDSIEPTGDRRDGLAGAIDAMRARAEEALMTGAGAEEAALIRGMVLGQDEEIDQLVVDDFRASGLAHLLAVSGQNVMLLGLLALPALTALGLTPRARIVALLSLIAVYVPLAGAGPSLQRAGAMGAAGLLAMALGRPASRWYGLLLAAGATLAHNPRVIGDPGWQLSFAAVVGILVLAPRLRHALRELPRGLAEGVAITVAATLATFPLLAHHFDQVSIASMPANLLALPAVAPAMWLGMCQVALGQVAGAGEPLASVAVALAAVAGTVNGVLIGYIAGVARRFAELPWAELELGLDSAIAVTTAYLLLLFGVAGVRWVARRAGPAATALAGSWSTAPRRARIAGAVAVAVVTLGLAAEATAPDAPPDRLTISFLDVGQGDATLVQHPDGGSILIDGGPAEARVYRQVEAAGVERLSMLVATHAAADHHGGLHEVLENIRVDLLLEGGDRTRDPDFRALLGEAESRGITTLPARAGQVLRLGGLTVEVLWPPPRGPGPPTGDPNLRAATTLVSAGDVDLFASGDAESPSLASLELPDVEVLKVPHHGSEDPGLPALLEELQPEIAAIGVGKGNTYGHPTASTLDALEDSGASVHRTDTDGTITVTAVEGALRISTDR